MQTWVKHLHLVGNDIDCCSLYAVSVGIFALCQATFDIDFRAFVQIAFAGFCELAPCDNVKPLGLFFSLARAGL